MKSLTPLKAIRVKCFDCSGFQPKEVRLCPVTSCPLHAFRFGSNPRRKGIGSSRPVLPQKSPTESADFNKEGVLGGGS